MRLVNALFTLTLAGFYAGALPPRQDARGFRMTAEFAALPEPFPFHTAARR